MLNGDPLFRWVCNRWHIKSSKQFCEARRKNKPQECEQCDGVVREKINKPINPCTTPDCNNEIKFAKLKLCNRCYQRLWKQKQKRGNIMNGERVDELGVLTELVEARDDLKVKETSSNHFVVGYKGKFFQLKCNEVKQQVTYVPVG
jgi:hypothetical protein